MNFSEIAGDNLSGAGEILVKACQLIDKELAKGIRPDKESLLQLLHAQPRMATLFNLVNFVLHEFDRTQPEASSSLRPGEWFLAQYKAAEEKIVVQLENLLDGYADIFTYSRSSLVMKALFRLKRPDQHTVYLCEGRPAHEGRIAARQLSEQGFHVVLMVDAAMAAGVDKSDLVLVGADALAPDYFINKIGTYPLALLSRERGKPFFVACPGQKFVPSLDVLPKEQQHPADEIRAEVEGVDVMNFYFEKVPTSLVTAFFTEKGILQPAELSELESSYHLHDILRPA